MFAVNTYEEIIKKERELNEKHIVILLFVRPSLPGAKEIIEEFNYLHYNSYKYCSIYAVGYTNNIDVNEYEDYQKVRGIVNSEWYYSDKGFVDFKNQLEKRLKWRYSGEIEFIILQSNPEGNEILNFQNYATIDVNYGIRNGYIESFSRLMEALIHSSHSEVETISALRNTRNSHYKISNIISETIDTCNKIPQPIKKVLKDRMFYKTSRSYV